MTKTMNRLDGESTQQKCNALPQSQYIDLHLPDGTHSGVRVDSRRGVLEIQRRGIKHYFDLAEVAQIAEQSISKSVKTVI